MFKKGKRRKTYRYYRRRRERKPSLRTFLTSKFLETSIFLLTLFLLLYAFSFYLKQSQPRAEQREGLILVRTQILNGIRTPAGSEEKDLAQKLAKRLKRLRVNNLVYEVVEIGKLVEFEPKESLILDRKGDKRRGCPSELALLTAKALGISSQNVICKELDNNYRDIALTIVIGTDYRIFFPPTEKL